MYSGIVNSFLKSLRALRFYVESVEPLASKHFFEVTDNPVATIMWMFKKSKESGSDLKGEVEKDEKMPDNLKSNISKLIVFAEDHLIEKEVDGKPVYNYNISVAELKEQYEKIEVQDKQNQILYSGSLMLLITYFENTISKLFRADFINHPQRVSLSNKSVPYKVLEDSESIEEVKNHLVDAEVTNMMYGSLSDWIDYFKKNMKMQLSYITNNYLDLIEIIARRNLFVHNDGIVNKIYLSLVGSEVKSKYGNGDLITIDKEYLYNAINIIERAGISLTFELWIKEYGKIDGETGKILDIIYGEYLFKERWECAKIFYDVCLSYEKMKKSESLMCMINRWQCFNWLDKFDEVRSEVEKSDVSAYSPRYQLGILALLDDVEGFFDKFDNQDEIGEDELRNWPLFKKIRESDTYNNRFSDEKNRLDNEEKVVSEENNNEEGNEVKNISDKELSIILESDVNTK
ncbi:hypothetical protein LXJ15735_04450 [Lacrimispora xylanolytica]